MEEEGKDGEEGKDDRREGGEVGMEGGEGRSGSGKECVGRNLCLISNQILFLYQSCYHDNLGKVFKCEKGEREGCMGRAGERRVG